MDGCSHGKIDLRLHVDRGPVYTRIGCFWFAYLSDMRVPLSSQQQDFSRGDQVDVCGAKAEHFYGNGTKKRWTFLECE